MYPIFKEGRLKVPLTPFQAAQLNHAANKKTITPQLFAKIVAIFPVVEIDKIRQDAYSSRLSLLRQQNFWSTQREFPLRFEKVFQELKKAEAKVSESKTSSLKNRLPISVSA